MRKKLVAGNWKMFGSLAENAALLDAVRAGAPAGGSVEAAVASKLPSACPFRISRRCSSR